MSLSSGRLVSADWEGQRFILCLAWLVTKWVPRPVGSGGVGEAWGLCTVAAFVLTQGTMQPLLSDRVLMLVIVVVTARRGLCEVPAVGGKSSALESKILGALQIHCLTLGSY